jgi:hypothetical protein
VIGRFAAATLFVCAGASAAASAEEPVMVRGYGMAVTAPACWHVRIGRGLVEASTAPLPPLGRWASTRLSRSLGLSDLGVLLFEDRATPTAPLTRSAYRPGHPRPFRASEFTGPPLGGSNPGNHGFASRNFRLAGRLFDLFVESGSRRPAAARVASLNRLLASLRIERGDFYPGEVAAAPFRPARGWHTLSSKPTPLAPETVSDSVASTVPYRDGLNDFPPQRTIPHLPSDGIILVLQLVASNRDPPLGPRQPRRGRLAVMITRCGSFEGVPPRVAVCALAGLRNRQYVIDGWVVYGRAHPTADMRSRAVQELKRLVLPSWPRWH